MRLAITTFEHVVLPGLAGRLQRIGADAALAAELGMHYDRYHAFLCNELEALGNTMPEPAAFGDDYAGYAAACNHVQELLRAEACLRQCAMAAGDSGVQRNIPLVDADHRLVDATSPSSRATVGAVNAAAPAGGWTPPPAPPDLES